MMTFPFVAITGQHLLKKALLIALIDPKLGGVLISGSRGSAKSTLVRGLQQLDNGMPLVSLPLGASEEMVTGSLHVQKIVQQGELEFSAGLLAKAHGGMLYVDEVNLLPDHLVDLLLDVSASGVNQVERDGISHRHAAQFVLIGTMNPDEGELRPQLLDRFALLAPVETQFSVAQRKEIVARRLEFDANPDQFIKQFANQTRQLNQTIEHARKILHNVEIDDAVSTEIAERCVNANVEGFRADLAMHRASVAHAALRGNECVSSEDVDAIANLVLAHRTNHSESLTPPNPPPSGGSNTTNNQQGDSTNGVDNAGSSIQGSWGSMPADSQNIETAKMLPIADLPLASHLSTSSLFSDQNTKGIFKSRGRNSWTTIKRSSHINWLKTVCHFSNRQIGKSRTDSLTCFYRQPVKKTQTLDVILLDTSVSMLSGRGLGLAHGALRYFSTVCYQQRRQLSLITFGNDQVQVRLSGRRAPKNIEPLLQTIKAGGGTPINRAISVTTAFLRKAQQRFEKCHLYLITDGKFDLNTTDSIRACGADSISIVDTEITRIRLVRCKSLAREIGAQYFHIEQLQTA